MPKALTVMGKPFEYEGSLARGLTVFFESSGTALTIKSRVVDLITALPRSRRVLVYQATKREFMDDVEADAIADHITAAFKRTVHRANPAEVTSWRNSME